MKKTVKYLIAAILLLHSTFADASFIKKIFPTKTPDKSFVISSKSKTLKMNKGQTYRMKMKLRHNRYYFISLKGKRFLGPVQCRIIVPSENNKVIFDNAAYELKDKILFFNNQDRDVVVEIKTMPCCYENELAKQGNVKLVFANKKIRKNEEFDFSDDYNMYALN